MRPNWADVATVFLFSWLFGLVCGVLLMVWIRAGRHFKTQNKIILLDGTDLQ